MFVELLKSNTSGIRHHFQQLNLALHEEIIFIQEKLKDLL